jgi:hypothetical protein
VRGRPKRNRRRRTDREPGESERRPELSLRFDADLPQGVVGKSIWRIRRRPVWNTMAAGAALFVAEGRCGAEALA